MQTGGTNYFGYSTVHRSKFSCHQGPNFLLSTLGTTTLYDFVLVVGSSRRSTFYGSVTGTGRYYVRVRTDEVVDCAWNNLRLWNPTYQWKWKSTLSRLVQESEPRPPGPDRVPSCIDPRCRRRARMKGRRC